MEAVVSHKTLVSFYKTIRRYIQQQILVAFDRSQVLNYQGDVTPHTFSLGYCVARYGKACNIEYLAVCIALCRVACDHRAEGTE
jgi:hypothetical protein